MSRSGVNFGQYAPAFSIGMHTIKVIELGELLPSLLQSAASLLLQPYKWCPSLSSHTSLDAPYSATLLSLGHNVVIIVLWNINPSFKTKFVILFWKSRSHFLLLCKTVNFDNAVASLLFDTTRVVIHNTPAVLSTQHINVLTQIDLMRTWPSCYSTICRRTDFLPVLTVTLPLKFCYWYQVPASVQVMLYTKEQQKQQASQSSATTACWPLLKGWQQT